MGDKPAPDELRRSVDEVLLHHSEDHIHALLQSALKRADSMNSKEAARIVLEYWWELARAGVVAVLGESSPSIVSGRRIPQFVLTERGRHLLELREKSPHNASRYLAAVRQRVSTPDEIALSYLAEAVDAWRYGLSRSSAVMLGCACERLVLLLAEAIASANCPPWSLKLKKKLQSRAFVSEVFDVVRNALVQLRGEQKLPRDLGDALDRKLSAIFDHARGLRNESGHPTGEEVSAEDAEAGLLLCPGFYELVDRLIAELSGLGPTKTGYA